MNEEINTKISLLEAENQSLKAEIQRLQNLLKIEGVEYTFSVQSPKSASNECIIFENISVEQIDLFITLFHGRTDVYAKRFISKTGTVGYSPGCHHFWRQGLCPKREGQKIKCFDCQNRNWIKLNRRLLREHLEGHKPDGTGVIGIYPMLADETCYFIVFDFDNHDKKKETNEDEGANQGNDWIDEVNAMRGICKVNSIDALVERSRSGKGAHVWLFFEEAIPVFLARRFGVNALVLVHNREIMKNWMNDIQTFLKIDEPLPTYETKKGKRSRKSLIGTLYAGHDSLGGIIDVAMITSFGKQDSIDERIKYYGLVIVDECHHAGAQTHEAVIREIQAQRVYGLTATPKREDGKEQKIFMQFGPIRYRLTAKDRAKMQDFEHYVYPRFTSLVWEKCGTSMKLTKN